MATESAAIDFDTRARGLRRVLRLMLRDKAGLVGVVLVVLLVLTAFLAPQLAPHAPLTQSLSNAKAPPVFAEGGSWDYPLGTDRLGRDILSRIIYGTRVSVTVGFFGAAIAVTLGMLIGLIAGFVGGKIDKVLMAAIDLILSIPYLVVVIVVAAVLGRSLFNVVVLFGVTASPIFARTTRGEVLRIRESGYVTAARASGAKLPRILVGHVMPNLVGPLVTLATFEMSAMIFYEAGLSFLGLSVPPTVPSWGNMLDDGRASLFTGLPWLSVFPGIAIAIAGLSMNLLGDWLRDVLDPRMRRARA
ncbi:MAG: ABC transporter permease [Actinobacteria bacterium]|nr:ABC transporter permease [Actinomycetota bacterium]